MPNHVHLIAVPESEDGLRRGRGEAHRRYTRHINSRENWRGHLWQGRVTSYVMDEKYLIAAARYIELNPVRAKLTKYSEEYPWSSSTAHLKRCNDRLVSVKPLFTLVDNWSEFLRGGLTNEEVKVLRKHERNGRPLGSKEFIKK